MNIGNLHSVHFLGIGGIGMSALARWFNHVGIKVSGYDKTPSPLTEALEAEGMQISFEDKMETVPARVLKDKNHVLIVWTPAMPKDSTQLNFFQSQGYDIKKRAAVLGLITADLPSIAVAGTHGKTTTSSMVAHLLKSGGKNIAAFLGGLTQNYNSNLILHDEAGGQPTVVVEADEFDRSFLHLHPNTAVVTSADPDHLDIYGDPEHLLDGFRKFVNLLPQGGNLYIHSKAFEKLGLGRGERFQIQQYGIQSGEIQARNIRPGPASFSFDYVGKGKKYRGFETVYAGIPQCGKCLGGGIDCLGLGDFGGESAGGTRQFPWRQKKI
jgi:UDP-N-acetylmuramate--alanine ligase